MNTAKQAFMTSWPQARLLESTEFGTFLNQRMF
jgi:hypothetical protein